MQCSTAALPSSSLTHSWLPYQPRQGLMLPRCTLKPQVLAPTNGKSNDAAAWHISLNQGNAAGCLLKPSNTELQRCCHSDGNASPQFQASFPLPPPPALPHRRHPPCPLHPCLRHHPCSPPACQGCATSCQASCAGYQRRQGCWIHASWWAARTGTSRISEMGITEHMQCDFCPILRECCRFFQCCCIRWHCAAIIQPFPMAASPMQVA